jgi:hypothetical protein
MGRMNEILYVADFIEVVSNPRGYEVVKLRQKEMNELEEEYPPEVILG